MGGLAVASRRRGMKNDTIFHQHSGDPLLTARSLPDELRFAGSVSPGGYKRPARLSRNPASATNLSRRTQPRAACMPTSDARAGCRDCGARASAEQVLSRCRRRHFEWSAGPIRYPRRLKARLTRRCTAVMYGCGDMSLLILVDLPSSGRVMWMIPSSTTRWPLAARARRESIVSGGAKVSIRALCVDLGGGGKLWSRRQLERPP